MLKMRFALGAFTLLALLAAPGRGETDGDTLQLRKEKALVESLKKAMTCNNQSGLTDGSLYCFVKFRGLELEFAGVNAKGGGSIYVTGLGQRQTLGTWGRRCILVMFGDDDLRGVVEAHVLFRDDGVITHNYSNKSARAACE